MVGNAEMCSGSEAGSYLRLIDSCATHLKAQGPSRTCNESKEEGKLTLVSGLAQGRGSRVIKKNKHSLGC